MKLLTVQPPELEWRIDAHWDGDPFGTLYKFEYILDDGTLQTIYYGTDDHCYIKASDDFTKIRVTVYEGYDVLATEDILIRPK